LALVVPDRIFEFLLRGLEEPDGHDLPPRDRDRMTSSAGIVCISPRL
jgi:hypothetical protein